MDPRQQRQAEILNWLACGDSESARVAALPGRSPRPTHRLRRLMEENRRPRQLVTDRTPDKHILQEVLRNKW